MKSRKELLLDLVLFRGDIKEIEKSLSHYSWDSEKPLLEIDEETFISILERCIAGEITLDALSEWANAIECREDLDFSNPELQEIIFELANSEINEAITKEKLREIATKLKSKSQVS